jgi:serine/threonine-protein kinase HipA
LDDPSASIDLALSVADYFGLGPDEAKQIAADVGAAVSSWREQARRAAISDSEIKRMSSAFDHGDLKNALTFVD